MQRILLPRPTEEGNGFTLTEQSSALRATLRLTLGAGVTPAEGSLKSTRVSNPIKSVPSYGRAGISMAPTAYATAADDVSKSARLWTIV